MKRAVLVTAGTVVGVAAALNYVPRPIDADLAASGVEAPSTADAVSEPVADESAGTEAVAQETAAPTVKKAKPAKPVEAAPESVPAAGSGSSKSGSTTTSGSTTKPSAAKPTPKPTATKKPAATPTSSTAPQPAASKAYTGTAAATPYGAVQVAITVKSGRIVEVAAVKYPNTDPKSKELAAKAIPVLKQETIAKQSASISNISGASFTCTGWKKSLQAALTQAGL